MIFAPRQPGIVTRCERCGKWRTPAPVLAPSFPRSPRRAAFWRGGTRATNAAKLWTKTIGGVRKLLTVAGGTKLMVSEECCCDEGAGEPCANCTGGSTPRKFITIDFSGITWCECTRTFLEYGIQKVSGDFNGAYCLEQDQEDSCRWFVVEDPPRAELVNWFGTFGPPPTCSSVHTNPAAMADQSLTVQLEFTGANAFLVSLDLSLPNAGVNTAANLFTGAGTFPDGCWTDDDDPPLEVESDNAALVNCAHEAHGVVPFAWDGTATISRDCGAP